MEPRRRTPAPDERQRDAERTRGQLLDAALEEFAAKGYAGARVQDIADRAGVNKHLISYYFGGKAGLYRAIQESWRNSEVHAAAADASLPDAALRYLHGSLADPRPARLLMWRSLEDNGEDTEQDAPENEWLVEQLMNLRRRRESGELAPGLDPAAVRVALMGMVMAPVLMPQLTKQIFGMDPRTPEFEDAYGEQLTRMINLLAGPGGE